jgi:hypothetical protein
MLLLLVGVLVSSATETQETLPQHSCREFLLAKPLMIYSKYLIPAIGLHGVDKDVENNITNSKLYTVFFWVG